MKKDTAKKLWFFAAACFVFLGITNRNVAFVTLGASYVCIGASMDRKKQTDTKEESDESEEGPSHK